MISGVMEARGTTMHGSERNMMSPCTTAWMETPLSVSRMFSESGDGSVTS